MGVELHRRGLLVTGETYDLRGALRGLQGRWDATLRGWVFPVERKAMLVNSLRARDDVAKVQDSATVKLELEACAKGLLVTGDTFPVKEHLKAMRGGYWDKELGGWVFPAEARAALRAALPSLMKLEEPPSWTLAKGGGTASAGARAVSQPSVLVVSSSPDVTPPHRESASQAGAPGGSAEKTAPCLALATRPRASVSTVAVRASGDHKVTETVQRKRMVKKGPAGTSVETATEKTERQVACRHTGAKVETQTVTRKRKVTETEDSIIETATVTVKRVRKK